MSTSPYASDEYTSFAATYRRHVSSITYTISNSDRIGDGDNYYTRTMINYRGPGSLSTLNSNGVVTRSSTNANALIQATYLNLSTTVNKSGASSSSYVTLIYQSNDTAWNITHYSYTANPNGNYRYSLTAHGTVITNSVQTITTGTSYLTRESTYDTSYLTTESTSAWSGVSSSSSGTSSWV